MQQIDEFVLLDIENVAITKQNLAQIAPEALEAVDAGILAFQSLAKKYGEVSEYATYNAQFAKWAENAGYSWKEPVAYLGCAKLIGKLDGPDSVADAQDNLFRAVSVISRAHLALRTRRDFIYGATDLLRVRITQALGILRVQSETAALLAIIAEQPKIGHDWLGTSNEDDGKDFYKTNHGVIVDRIKTLGLHDMYMRGSNMAMHSRAGGTALGVLLGRKQDGHQGRVRMVYQEVDNPQLLLFWFAVYLRFHGILANRAADLYPELRNELESIEGLRDFITLESRVRGRAIEEYQKIE